MILRNNCQQIWNRSSRWATICLLDGRVYFALTLASLLECLRPTQKGIFYTCCEGYSTTRSLAFITRNDVWNRADSLISTGSSCVHCNPCGTVVISDVTIRGPSQVFARLSKAAPKISLSGNQKARHRLYFLRSLKSFGMSRNVLVPF